MHNFLAVVVSYGGSPQLHCLLTALAGVAGCRVTLVENRGGTEHEGLPAGVEVYDGHGNVGYGTAVNIAVRGSLAADGSLRPTGDPAPERPEWILVVNSDVTVPARTCEQLPELLASVPAGTDALGFPLRAENGGPGRGTAVLPNARTNAYVAVRGEAAAVARWPDLRYPVGAFFAIRTSAFLRLGGFDPSYWMYYEETDLFARLHAAGGRVGWADDRCQVAHVGGGTVGRAGLLYAELGRSAAIYARRHRATLGRGWLAVHVGQLVVLALRKLAAGRTHDARRAMRILGGLAVGIAQPGREPATTSRWRAVPSARRRELGRIDPETLGAGAAVWLPRPRSAVSPTSWVTADR
ncbi:glycosyltransferase family 2 protein [Parafrankia sp. EUN1f]|uniref:glycosyltransferase family 2 protein n=1 Tax=Parafrankia sp. EUN1f TaxID=102897 RepID=UPI0001C4461D|nr:galactosyltransferase-related protein [Parafrankia sp. EUN1f]EFC85653.1 glycosyltransferase-like protein [Parafrankia sp. EUN1f]